MTMHPEMLSATVKAPATESASRRLRGAWMKEVSPRGVTHVLLSSF
jgi:hypothetical protein